jgi:hypothetical protein
MSAAMPAFDTYKYIRTLKDAGFTEAQAEVQSSALLQAFDADHLATKDDLHAVEARLTRRLNTLEATLTGQATLLRWVGGSSMVGMLSSVIGLSLFIAGKLA